MYEPRKVYEYVKDKGKDIVRKYGTPLFASVIISTYSTPIPLSSDAQIYYLNRQESYASQVELYAKKKKSWWEIILQKIHNWEYRRPKRIPLKKKIRSDAEGIYAIIVG